MTDNKPYDEDLPGLESKRNVQHVIVYFLRRSDAAEKHDKHAEHFKSI